MNPRHIITMMGGPFPFGYSPEHPEDNMRAATDNFVPPRVTKAMEFLHQLAVLRQRRAPAVSEHEIEVVEQQRLSDEEMATRDAACVLLAKYFDGKLELDRWESLRHDHIKKRLEHDPEQEDAKQLLRCFSCNPNVPPRPNCPLCRGTGQILVQPVVQQHDPIVEMVEEVERHPQYRHPEMDIDDDEFYEDDE